MTINQQQLQQIFSNQANDSQSFLDQTRAFFQTLGIFKQGMQRNYTTAQLKEFITKNTATIPNGVNLNNIQHLGIICQLDENCLAQNNYAQDIYKNLQDPNRNLNFNYSAYLVVAMELINHPKPSKTLLANYTRLINLAFSGSPVLVLIKHQQNQINKITLAMVNKRPSQTQIDKNVITKVILLKDIDIQKPHTAHLKLLNEIAITNQTNFEALHQHWMQKLSIKTLTEEFYNQIQTIFDQLKNQIQFPPQSNLNQDQQNDFALKLVGRLIFCWFLKAKGWIPNQLLNSNHQLLTNQDNQNYYHQILEPLFFETLNKPKDSRNYNLLDTNTQNLLNQVPYLNGGLFEPSPTDLYQNQANYQLQVPNLCLQQLLQLFESYYFTIDENTSLEEDIGVDPEMMGRVFENFIVNRSSTGSFYTPREIVDYLTNTSLKEYLVRKLPELQNQIQNLFDTKYWQPTQQFLNDYGTTITDELNQIKVLDPACGSGAFPIGVLQKMTELVKTLNPNQNLFAIKKQILENCIFGVDILPIAVEISRLRCWLSLVVDEDNQNIEPLPNLEFKFVCANSLVGIKKSQSGGLANEQIDLKTQELVELRHQSFKPGQDRQALRERWRIVSGELFKLQIESRWYLQDQTDLTSWDPFGNQPASFFDSQWMFGIKNFGLVIGNPPYVGEKNNEHIFSSLKQTILGQRFYQGKMDLFYFFFHLGLDLLKENGVLGFITTNYFITADGAIKLNADFKNRANIIKFINFNKLKVFKSAIGQHNMITILSKKSIQPNGQEPIAQTIITKNKGYLDEEILSKILSGQDPNTNYYQIPQSKLYLGNNINLIGGGIDKILDKMMVDCKRLGKICNVNQGIVSGADKVSLKHLKKHPSWEQRGLQKGDGIFILTDAEIEDLAIKGKKYVKKLFKNSHIQKYTTNTGSIENILYIDKNFDASQNPEVVEHLQKFRENLKQRREANSGKIRWFELWRSRRASIFEEPKIVAPQRSKTNTFGYNEVPWYASADVYFITQPKFGYNLKFLLGVLNSKLIYKWLCYRGKRKGQQLELCQTPLSQIPIPPLNTSEKQQQAKQIEDLVNQIIQAKKDNQDTTELESQVDDIVYQMYELSEQEILLINDVNS